MGRIFSFRKKTDQGERGSRRWRQRLLLALGVGLFAAGAAILGIGLVSYFDDGSRAEPSSVGDSEQFTGIDDVEYQPVTIPYYDPERSVNQPEPPAPTVPMRLVIESLNVDAPVIEMGMDSQGVPHVPLNGQDVAWYDFSSRPGAGSNAVFAAHINWARAPGVFADLDHLQVGDSVRLLSDDGREFTYKVFANFPVDPANPDSLKVMAPTEVDTVTLITCGGTWVPDASERFGGNYTNRTIVQAKLVSSSVQAPVPGEISDS